MNSGDVMRRKTAVNRVLQGKRLILGSAAVLLLLSAGGLTLVAQHAREEANAVVMLLALHLASWSYALGIAGLLLVPILEVIDWLHLPVKRESMSRYSPVEAKRRDFEQPEMDDTSSLQRDVASVALSRLSRQSNDRNQASSSTKVA